MPMTKCDVKASMTAMKWIATRLDLVLNERYSAATHYSGYAQRGIYAITILMGIRRQIYVLKVKQLSSFPQLLIVKQCGGVNLLL